jgi:Protein of unknown function (DUF3108)
MIQTMQVRSAARPSRWRLRAVARLWLGGAAPAVLAMVFCCPVAGAVEELEYGWKLKGFGGALIGLFFPHSGDAMLRTETGPGAASTTVLELTSPHRDGEFYRYGSEIGTTGQPVRVWSAYQFRGKSKMRERDVGEEEVLDFASAIHALRRDRPSEERRIRLWSDGREYPLSIVPAGEEHVDCGGRSWTARRYVIEGRRVEGEKFFKGRFQLWLADDPAATPVRIVGEKGLLTVRLELAEASRDGEASHALEPLEGDALSHH